ncbi:MAG: hypothetical protein R3B54_11125 [Bdellovibrionota bacterium]
MYGKHLRYLGVTPLLLVLILVLSTPSAHAWGRARSGIQRHTNGSSGYAHQRERGNSNGYVTKYKTAFGSTTFKQNNNGQYIWKNTYTNKKGKTTKTCYTSGYGAYTTSWCQ